MQISHNDFTDNVTGILLAGGKSRRMGYDKAHIEIGGHRLLTRSLDLLCHYFATVLIAGDRQDLVRPNIPAIPDIYPGSALGGLYTGLQSAKTDWIFVAPCDMPYPDAKILELLLRHRNGADAVVPRTPAGYEPVFALYHKSCLPHMLTMLQQEQYRIYDFYQRIKVHYLDWQQMPDGWERSLLNINTPEQLKELQLEVSEQGAEMSPPVVSIVAKSGTGKTTLLEKLIAEMKERGFRVGAIKHDAHSFNIDHEGKDSWRLTQAGADTMLITSPDKLTMVKQHSKEHEPTLAETVRTYCHDIDIVLTEGFKRSTMPKIEVHRRERSEKLLCRDEGYDPSLIAVASDSPLQVDVPLYDINDAKGLCDLIVERFLS
ncbi:MAG: bifunctional molybdenum cofactor guanylyltransferase MobA/molybdopterin-guanine dinucleotide biosynthesis adaptor protein MobB [Desulfuromonadales bacterium]|nr:bifunctional molybdenum cofactor guanylyltransferase MobA/molybdopterin-guanine dinucleotide biosynthesis adaptor protein MobB [Desulfuromonadales bacterium]